MIKNLKVVIFSIIALVFMILTFTVNLGFIIPVTILIYLNQRELMKK